MKGANGVDERYSALGIGHWGLGMHDGFGGDELEIGIGGIGGLRDWDLGPRVKGMKLVIVI